MSQITLLDVLQAIVWAAAAVAPFAMGLSCGEASRAADEALRTSNSLRESDRIRANDATQFMLRMLFSIGIQIAVLIAVYKAGGKP